MNDAELEQRLRSWYRAEIPTDERSPAALRSGVLAIPRASSAARRWIGTRRGFMLLAAAALVSLIGGTVAMGGLPALRPLTNELPLTPTTNAGRIVFHRIGVDEVERYFAINADGTNETALYEATGCGCAHLSADGTQVLTVGETDHGTWSLMTLDLDGGRKRVIDPPMETLNLFIGATSADGRVLAFNGMDETDASKKGLWLASPDLVDARLVAPLLEGWMEVEPFGLSPDGSKIVFFVETGPSGDTTHAGDVYVINADGSGLRQLNPSGTNTEYIGMPVISISPDGRQAAFGANNAVFVVDLESGVARPVTPRTGFVWAVSWSPTGEWLTYTRFHGETSAVALVRPDGSDDHEITALEETDEANAAVWSPDGKYLLVPRDSDATVDGPKDLWIMDLEGTWVTQVTREPSTYGTYSWAASGS